MRIIEVEKVRAAKEKEEFQKQLEVLKEQAKQRAEEVRLQILKEQEEKLQKDLAERAAESARKA